MKKMFVVCAVGCLFGCGAKNAASESTTSAEPIKTPATVEQAAGRLDLSTFPLMDGAKATESRHVANLSYIAPGDPKKALEFHRKTFGAQGWKELPNSTISDQSASAMFSREGFVVSLSVIPFEPSGVTVRLQNLGNVKPGKLPVPAGAKPVYVGDSTAMYSTDVAVPATAHAIRNLFFGQGWVPYGKAGDSDYFKQNAILATSTVSSAPAQGGKTMIQYSNQLISSDIPAPPNVEDLRYVDEKPTMIFRNRAKEMLTLATTGVLAGKLLVSVRFQSAAEIAERDRRIKELAPKLRAAAEAKAAKEAAELAERNKVPKVAVTLPADAKDVKQTKDSIKFIVGKGKAKAAVESFRKQFRDGGWKEDVASLERMAGTLLFSKDGQSLNITYSDTGFMPTEVSLSAMRAELEAAK